VVYDFSPGLTDKLGLWRLGQLMIGSRDADAENLSGTDSRQRLPSLADTPEPGLEDLRAPDHHRDPFDRFLIAQAAIEELALVSVDRQFAKYKIRFI